MQNSLDVEIRSGGPQVNGMQLLLSKRADVIIGATCSCWKAFSAASGQRPLPRPSVRSPGLLTHADVTPAGAERQNPAGLSSGQATWWPWLKAQYQLSDAQVRPYTFTSTFVVDDAVAQQAYVSSEVFGAEGRSEGALLPLFRTRLSPYGILIARPDHHERKAAMAKFVARLNGGWVSYLKDPAPGNALIKQDNPKMTDDLLAWGVT